MARRDIPASSQSPGAEPLVRTGDARTGDSPDAPSMPRISVPKDRRMGVAAPSGLFPVLPAWTRFRAHERGRPAAMTSDVFPVQSSPDAPPRHPRTAGAPPAEPAPVVAATSESVEAEPSFRAANLRRYRMSALLMLVDVVTAGTILSISGVPVWLVVAATLTLAVLDVAAGLNRSRFTLSALDDLPPLLGRSLLVSALVLVLTRDLVDPVSTVGVMSLALAMVAARTVAYEFVRVLRRRGVITHRVLVLGAGVVGRDLAAAMIEHRELGLTPVGFVDAAPLGGPAGLPVPVVGTPADLAEQMTALEADHVIIAFTALRESEMVEMLRTCDRLQAEISVVPRLFELAHRGRDTDEIDGVTLVRLRRAPFRSPMWPLKRLFDLTTSGLALLLLSPILAAVALAVRIVDGPGVIFRQERVGLDGRTFYLMKFRSLRPTNESESDTRWNIKNDDRMSWLGRIMRKTSIDELPQLFNIVRGDMSLVGPRPERPHFVATFDDAYPRYGARHRVPSGLTGWAQIHGLRGDTSIEERARFDNYYIENWSLWLDVKIILRTVATLTKGAG